MDTQSPPQSSARSESQSTENRSAETEAPAEAGLFHDAILRLREISEYFSYYLAIKADELKLAVRSVVLYAALGVVALVTAAAAVVVAVVLMMVGLAKAIGTALGGMEWLGDLIVGVGVLLVIVVAAMVVVHRVTGSSKKLTVEKYESRKRQQRSEFGRDVRQRAGETHE